MVVMAVVRLLESQARAFGKQHDYPHPVKVMAVCTRTRRRPGNGSDKTCPYLRGQMGKPGQTVLGCHERQLASPWACSGRVERPTAPVAWPWRGIARLHVLGSLHMALRVPLCSFGALFCSPLQIVEKTGSRFVRVASYALRGSRPEYHAAPRLLGVIHLHLHSICS
ncbi:hypothetical protein N8I77_005244 [Diaporthe amygdali]|uniref:Uncharacterized protein n=1 Tax=Phomopsis amygdali TaxID=1214568 RepID=A0AAD9W2R5_PHOAM|nr:hypothetical protein N8I77_005244 [Diaporthe amygdali]